MPYKNNSELPAQTEGLPAHAKDIWRKTFNSAAKEYGKKNEIRLFKIAWAAVKREYKRDENKKWIEKKGIKAASEETIKTHKYTTDDWVRIGKVDQGAVGNNTKRPLKIGLDAFKAAEGTWDGGRISINHGASFEGHTILDEKFDGEFLYAKFDEDVIRELNSPKCTGGSIEALDFEYDAKGVLIDMAGTGYGITYKGTNPICTPEMGCAGIVASLEDDIPTKDREEDAVITGGLDAVTEIEPQNHVISQKGGDREGMEDKKIDESVSYTGKQVDDRIEAALAEQKETLDNAHEVAITGQKTEYETKAETLKKDYDGKMEALKTEGNIEKEEAIKVAEEKATIIAELKHKGMLSEEAIKQVETLDLNALQVFNSLNIPAAVDTPLGIIAGVTKEEKTEMTDIITWGDK
jgi:cation transport regulator